MEKLPFHLLAPKAPEKVNEEAFFVEIPKYGPQVPKTNKNSLERKFTPQKRPVSIVPNGGQTRNEEKPIVLSKDPPPYEYNQYFAYLRKMHQK